MLFDVELRPRPKTLGPVIVRVTEGVPDLTDQPRTHPPRHELFMMDLPDMSQFVNEKPPRIVIHAPKMGHRVIKSIGSDVDVEFVGKAWHDKGPSA